MQKIISVVPSQTEFLYDLGLDEEVIGITKFCVHPESWFRTKTRVGGTKQLNIDLIRELDPDLILANKEENVKEQIEELAKDFNVWISDIHDLDDAYAMMQTIGELTGKTETANNIIDRIRIAFSQLQTPHSPQDPLDKLQTLYLIWKNPYMSVGHDTFIHSMLEIAGFENCCRKKLRYPELTIEEIRELNPDLIFLSSEPFPFKEKHVQEFSKLELRAKIMLVDGEMFSWYGSRLLKAVNYFKRLRPLIPNS